MDGKKDAMNRFMQTFMLLQQFNCPKAIDAMFETFLNENWERESIEINKLMIVFFLRTNFKIRDQLSNYNSLLNKSIKYLKDKDIDPKKLLHGLV